VRVLVTGASGFVGGALIEQLRLDDGLQLRLAQRRAIEVPFAECIQVGDINGATDWQTVLAGVDVVVHLAARAHILHHRDADPLAMFREVNTQGTLNLARQAAFAGVRRFVFISSIGVNGAQTKGQAFNERSAVSPHSPYAQSKYEAECGLLNMAESGVMEVVIIRPPMIFAAHAPGNFARLLKLTSLPVPLPFGGMDNLRSLVSLQNLIGFIELCVKSPHAANEVFLICDGDDVSTEEMVRRLAKGMGCRRWLLPFPKTILHWMAILTGRESMYIQLFGSLQIDAGKARELLQWEPRVSTHQGLEEAGRRYKAG